MPRRDRRRRYRLILVTPFGVLLLEERALRWLAAALAALVAAATVARVLG